MRRSLRLNSDHYKEIRAEIGDRLRAMIASEQPKLPSRLQQLLDRLARHHQARPADHEEHSRDR
jgi:hypothetical protein